MAEPGADRPTVVRDATTGESSDPRIQAVLEVLAGESSLTVAQRWSVEEALLLRWLRAFVEAGTAQVTNRPVGEIARQRDRFLTTFMHGLRTPLAVAQMWVGLLTDSPHDGATTTEIAAHLQASLDQLDERATDVELLTAAMLGRLVLEARRIAIGSLTRALEPVLHHVGGEGADVEVSVDPTLCSRILRDLWAAAHSGSAPRSVRLEVETVSPWIEVRVVREGDPLDPAVLHAMFEPFDRDDDSAQVTVGLYLARALSVVHGGTIGVEQDHRRTTFAVRIPDARLAGVARE